jgi:hypothetical protein
VNTVKFSAVTLTDMEEVEMTQEYETKEWERREHHSLETRDIVNSNGCCDKEGRIRRWTPEAADELRRAGHSSLSFELCECRTRSDEEQRRVQKERHYGEGEESLDPTCFEDDSILDRYAKQIETEPYFLR